MPWSVESIFGNSVTPGLIAGGTFTSALTTLAGEHQVRGAERRLAGQEIDKETESVGANNAMSVSFGTGCPRRARDAPAGAAGPETSASGRRPAPPARPGTSLSLSTSALLLLLGIAPVVYAIYLALSNSGGFGTSFVDAFNDYRFVPAFEHVLEFMAIWLVSQTILVVALTLMLHNLRARVGAAFRFLFYIPGALAGAASVIVWLFMLDPTASPFAFILHWLGYAQFDNTDRAGQPPRHLRDHGFLDGRRRVDRRHVRRAQQHPPRAPRVRADRRRERLQDRALRSSFR